MMRLRVGQKLRKNKKKIVVDFFFFLVKIIDPFSHAQPPLLISLLGDPEDRIEPACLEDPHHDTNLFAHLSLLSDPEDLNDPAYHDDPHHHASLYSSLTAQRSRRSRRPCVSRRSPSRC